MKARCLIAWAALSMVISFGGMVGCNAKTLQDMGTSLVQSEVKPAGQTVEYQGSATTLASQAERVITESGGTVEKRTQEPTALTVDGTMSDGDPVRVELSPGEAGGTLMKVWVNMGADVMAQNSFHESMSQYALKANTGRR
ncbi:MAG: hypothetical protein KDA27_12990 [Candidatus Eisenbacteria bacterium]|uniref:DUF3568 family protein n=1 Tax=Eiseniibacteriota bacterium TaxID=2212470 RepID=A0A956SFW6_UNCEI|nr:hypothetical protein [Candidatus Eisenbacteria bacterium]MCB9465866.1 hypothetical protein [Candidatus Eisenbacteria bacterium]